MKWECYKVGDLVNLVHPMTPQSRGPYRVIGVIHVGDKTTVLYAVDPSDEKMPQAVWQFNADTVVSAAFAKNDPPRDAINPDHYKSGGIETIDFVVAKLGREGAVAFCKGNVLKYASRAGKKNDEAEDMEKCAWYADKAVELLRMP